MDKIFSDIKNSVGSAVKKSGEIVELTKLKLALADTKNELKAKLAELGELTYKAYKGADAADAEEIISQIDELKEALELQEARLAALKKQKVCSNCDTAADIDAKYCSHCGGKFDEETQNAEEI